MNTPTSFKTYHGFFGRFQGCLDISANFNPGEWTEVVGKKGKKMRSKRYACSVGLGPCNNQAGTTGFAYFDPGEKRTAPIRNGVRNPPKRNFVKLGNRKQKGKQEQWKSAKEQ